MKKYILALVTAAWLASSYGAVISVVPLDMSLTNTQRFGDISVSNLGKTKAYVETYLFRVMHPGTKQHKKIKLDYASPLKFGVLVSPTKLVLNPGQTSRFRLLSVIPPGKVDKVYQVKVVPTQGQWFPVKGGHNKNFHGMVDLVTGYLVTVILRPARTHPHITLTRHGKTLIVKNDGNTYVRVFGAQACTQSGDCHPAEGMPNLSMFSGNKHVLSLKRALPIRYRMLLPGGKMSWVASS